MQNGQLNFLEAEFSAISSGEHLRQTEDGLVDVDAANILLVREWWWIQGQRVTAFSVFEKLFQ
jgi:hypothetical protein